jgi:hypothetical protein
MRRSSAASPDCRRAARDGDGLTVFDWIVQVLADQQVPLDLAGREQAARAKSLAG